MESRQNMMTGLKYTKEHLICENYVTGEQAILEIIEVDADKHLVWEDMERSALIFVLSGQIEISTYGLVWHHVHERQMFFVNAGDSFYGKSVAGTSLLRCSFGGDMALCNRFSIAQLHQFVSPSSSRSSNEIPLLPIHELLFKELETTKQVMQTGMSCIHFQRIKKEILFIELRGFYQKEELARLFSPIIGMDYDFKHRVMQVSTQVKTAKELIDKLNMSPTSFKRKFQESFGTSARQWLIQKKKDSLLRDLLLTDVPVMELADKYNFTTNYITTFCQQHFGKSPTALRQEHKE